VKIDGSLKTPVTSSSGSRGRAERTSGSGESQAGSQVQLSAASAQLAGASSGAPIDGARIAEIKLAISEGRFKINAEAIADGLIDSARSLLQSQRKA
jgi:negative regulator of flagellin synthesis FlgM